MSLEDRHVTVVGAGVMGLTSAPILLNAGSSGTRWSREHRPVLFHLVDDFHSSCAHGKHAPRRNRNSDGRSSLQKACNTMGDKSPKSNQKKKSQKDSKSNSANQKKKQATLSKQSSGKG